MSDDCIFCKIVSGELPSEQLYQDEQVIAFRDLHPVAPVHVLVIPRKHIPSMNDLEDEDKPLIGEMFSVTRDLARHLGLAKSGYRLIVNNGPDGGQVVYHLHLHLIGGHRMRYPMG